jgi:hypothetical protein
LITQATTSIAGGLIGVGPFLDTKNATVAMNSIAGNIPGVYAGIFLQIVTALIIIVLGSVLYQAGKYISITASIIALGLYLAEALIHIVCQIVVFALADVSQQFVSSGDATLIIIGNLLLTARGFCGAITMMPFGFGQ